MDSFENYFVILAWAIVISLTLAVSYGFSIWIFDKMLMEIGSLKNLAKRPIATAIVLAAFMYSIAMIVSAMIK